MISMKVEPSPKLTSPFFLISLATLLLNDFVLKQQFHNALTGKLSDIAGLIVFALFWNFVFPRLKLEIYCLTALLFILWKSPYSQSMINWWNSFSPIHVARTVDYTDLIALLVLPISYYRSSVCGAPLDRGWATCLVAVVTILAFTATSFSKKTPYENEYYFPIPKAELVEAMSRLPEHDVFPWHNRSETFEILFDSCTSRATISVVDKDRHAVVRLQEIDYRCPSRSDKEKMREYFEKEFIDKLRELPPSKSPNIKYIWAQHPPDIESEPSKQPKGKSSPHG